jgi:deglycase
MNLKGKRIAILVDNYFEQAGFEVPLDFLRQLGAEVSIVDATTQNLQGMRHTDPGDMFRGTLLLEKANSQDYDALVLPGGVINADSLRMVPKARAWVIDFTDRNKLIAAICHAPWLLVSADVIEGRRLTSNPTLQDDICNAGAIWVDKSVVVDDNFITSRNSEDLGDFTKAIQTWFSTAAV